MIREFELTAGESLRAAQMQAEHRDLIFRYGAAMLEVELVKSLLPQMKDRQKYLIDEIVLRNGVSQYLNARIEGDKLVCQIEEKNA